MSRIRKRVCVLLYPCGSQRNSIAGKLDCAKFRDIGEKRGMHFRHLPCTAVRIECQYISTSRLSESSTGTALGCFGTEGITVRTDWRSRLPNSNELHVKMCARLPRQISNSGRAPCLASSFNLLSSSSSLAHLVSARLPVPRMSPQSVPDVSTRAWKNAFLVLLLFSSVFLLYDFATAAGHVSSIRSRLMKEASVSVESPEPSVVEHGIDARLVWNKGSVPPTRLLRHAPGM